MALRTLRCVDSGLGGRGRFVGVILLGLRRHLRRRLVCLGFTLDIFVNDFAAILEKELGLRLRPVLFRYHLASHLASETAPDALHVGQIRILRPVVGARLLLDDFAPVLTNFL